MQRRIMAEAGTAKVMVDLVQELVLVPGLVSARVQVRVPGVERGTTATTVHAPTTAPRDTEGG